MTDTTANTYHKRTVAALEDFIHQRPNLEPENYISSGWDEEGRKEYRKEARRITRDLNDARLLLRQVTGRDFTEEEWNEAFTDTYRRNISCLVWDGTTLDYCTGQYWPTEYRASVCAVLAYLLWRDYRRAHEPFTGQYWPTEHRRRMAHFRRMLGRGLVHRWFN
jgi:hypothetical protein